MEIIGWILFGFVAGLVARAVLPGSDRIGCIATVAVGIVGALIGGFLGEALLEDEVEFASWSLKSFLLSVAGAMVLLLVLRAAGGRRRN